MKKKIYSALFYLGSKVFGGTAYRNSPFLRKIRNYIARQSRPSLIEVGGLRLSVDPVLGMTMSGGAHEAVTTNVILSSLKEGDVFINVGADIGYFTCLAARHVGPSGAVYAFEPNPESFRMLKKNIEDNNLDNVKIFPYAVEEKKNSRPFYANGPFGTLGFDRFRDGGKVIDVETTYLDNIFGDKAVNMVLIDAEGSEAKIIRGMARMLAKNPDLKLILEFNPVLIEGSGDSPKELLDGLLSAGFTLFALDDGRNLPPAKVSSESLLRAYTAANKKMINILCVRKS